MPHLAIAIHWNARPDWFLAWGTLGILLIIGVGGQRCVGDELSPVALNAVHYELVGDVSHGFQQEVRKAWNSIPPVIGRRVMERGWQLKLTTFIVEAVPELDGVQPRGWPGGSTWNNTDAVHLSDQRILVLAEKRRTRDGQVITNDRVAGVLGHEVGHAFDLACYPQERISSTTRFRQAYQRDVKILSTQSTGSLAYYLQGTDVGRQETFAEAFARITGGGSDVHQQESFEKAFPTVMRTVRSIIADHDE